jgi:hypothetical protein
MQNTHHGNHQACEPIPDAEELISTFECEDYVNAEWKPTAAQTESFGSLSYRSPILLCGPNRRL